MAEQPTGQKNGKTRNAQLASDLDRIFRTFNFQTGAMIATFGHQMPMAELRESVATQIDDMKAEVLDALLSWHADRPAKSGVTP